MIELLTGIVLVISFLTLLFKIFSCIFHRLLTAYYENRRETIRNDLLDELGKSEATVIPFKYEIVMHDGGVVVTPTSDGSGTGEEIK